MNSPYLDQPLRSFEQADADARRNQERNDTTRGDRREEWLTQNAGLFDDLATQAQELADMIFTVASKANDGNISIGDMELLAVASEIQSLARAAENVAKIIERECP